MSQKTIDELKKDRKAGDISREEYWKAIQELLRQLDNLAVTLNPSGVSLHTRGGKLITQIPLRGKASIELYLDTEDIRTVPFCVIADGKYEPFQSDIILGLAGLSKHFIDIGANVGFYSIAAARINPQLCVKSFEPNPVVAGKLTHNVDLNYISSQIQIFECALGSENIAEGELLVPDFTGSGGGSLKNLHPDEGIPKHFSIKVRVLDEILNIDPMFVDLIKIDVEGYEKFVLDGGMTTISGDKPTIIVELLRKWMAPFNTSPQEVLISLKSLGYLCYGIQEAQLLKIEVIDDLTKETNFVFIHPSSQAHFSWMKENVLGFET